ncbi:nucleoside triphosphate pyrophosphohydrolase [Rhodococcus sp. ACPA4]|uniref:MazG family protein n=1 Tax=Rhodococcus TaxID=1827 RepID=UPI000BB0EFFA|nr:MULTISPECIES: MazG family protein [Rhodococcus]MCE4262980.1 MazG family protein [Rhodococcus globerulus]PBC37864.1 nucleoside triphosphate pyrophosphohydrolase [Rhodococcus sp. ACPA4]QXW02199.1 MazG family protein [Rhodococcus globerulus]RZL27111.1 MAG: nucleoside triphosphate pyrophosphohydrolase [Rhodococcus sp. (in: high G+C Gram-positive bacteria)]
MSYESVVVVLDATRPDSIPVNALTVLRDPIEIADDVPHSTRRALPTSVPGAAVYVTSNPNGEGAVERVARGARLIAAEALKGDELVAASRLMDRLWSYEGWEVAQTHESLVRYLLEETYEVLDAIVDGDRQTLREELGDLLLQVLFHSRIAEAVPGEEAFDIDDVARGLIVKLTHRTPHLATDPSGDIDVAAQERAWDEMKAIEKRRASELDGVAVSQPAFRLVEQYVSRVSRAGFPEELIPVELIAMATQMRDLDGLLRMKALSFADRFRVAEQYVKNHVDEVDRAPVDCLTPPLDRWSAAWRLSATE